MESKVYYFYLSILLIAILVVIFTLRWKSIKDAAVDKLKDEGFKHVFNGMGDSFVAFNFHDGTICIGRLYGKTKKIMPVSHLYNFEWIWREEQACRVENRFVFYLSDISWPIHEINYSSNTTIVEYEWAKLQAVYKEATSTQNNFDDLISMPMLCGSQSDPTKSESILIFLEKSLRKGIHEEPRNEKDVQNAIETLLIGTGMKKGVDYDRETGRVKHAGKESIPDFVFFLDDRVVLEVKLSNRPGKLPTIIDEIGADIIAYSKSYKPLFFLIYDIGFIRDDLEIIREVEQTDYVRCVIIKH